jgi:hypothetical protein
MINKKNLYGHGFHLVDPSPWPIISAFSALFLTVGGVFYMHGHMSDTFLWKYGLFMILFMMFVWWRDIIREGTYEGQHTKSVQTGLKIATDIDAKGLKVFAQPSIVLPVFSANTANIRHHLYQIGLQIGLQYTLQEPSKS